MRHGIWATLDLDPTTDRSAIRKAYAAQLKAMDVDADPDGFAALRAARDAALAGDTDPLPDVDWEMEGAVGTLYSTTVERPELEPQPEPEPEPEPDPEIAAFHDAINAHLHALESLLFPGHDTPPTEAELASIEHHGHALLADPRMEQIDFATSAERWFADTLAASIPRSDPLLEPAAAAFGWIDRRNDYALSGEAQTIVERIGATRFAAMLDDPKHRFHRAWRELTRTDTGRAEWRVKGGLVRELLSTVRQRYPVIEQWMNPVRVDKWDRPAKSSNGTYWWIAIVIAVTVLRFALSGTHYPTSPPAAHASVNEVAREMTGLSIDKVRAANPALASAIMQAVTDSSAGTSASVIGRTLTEDLVSHGLSDLPEPVLLQLTRWDLDQMRAVQGPAPEECEKVNLMQPGLVMASTIQDRRQELLRDVIWYARERPISDTTYRFVIPFSIVDQMAARTKLPPETIGRALQNRETAETRCTVQIALREAALRAEASVGLPLLRDLQPLIVHDRTKTKKSGE